MGGRAQNVGMALETFGLLPLRDIPVVIRRGAETAGSGLARLLVAERPVWLLDEPATSL